MKKIQNILDLKPTQFAVGMLEVDEKVRTVQEMDKKDRKAYFKDNVVPVVRSPRGELYM